MSPIVGAFTSTLCWWRLIRSSNHTNPHVHISSTTEYTLRSSLCCGTVHSGWRWWSGEAFWDKEHWNKRNEEEWVRLSREFQEERAYAKAPRPSENLENLLWLEPAEGQGVGPKGWKRGNRDHGAILDSQQGAELGEVDCVLFLPEPSQSQSQAAWGERSEKGNPCLVLFILSTFCLLFE